MTNYACLGYMINALQALNLDEKVVKNAIDETYMLFDTITEQQAENKYLNMEY